MCIKFLAKQYGCFFYIFNCVTCCNQYHKKVNSIHPKEIVNPMGLQTNNYTFMPSLIIQFSPQILIGPITR